MSKIGIIDVGGGVRAVYAAGVLEYCLENNITFDMAIGVSSGSGNLTNFISRQKGNNKRYYTDFSLRKECASLRNIITKGYLIDLEYIYGKLINSDGEAPLDYETFVNNEMGFTVVATDAETGEAVYFDKSDIKLDNYRVLMASSCIPSFSKPAEVEGKIYFDGALSDSIPVDKAFEMGCDKVVLILARPKTEERKVGKDIKYASKIKRKYPNASSKMEERALLYNESLKRAKEYERQGKLLIVAPDDTCGVTTVTKDVKALEQLYEKGMKDAVAIAEFIK